MTAPLPDESVLELHRRLVGIRSISHEEEAVADFLHGYLREHGVDARRLGRNVFARAGEGPRLLFNSHHDTVPPGAGWTREPWEVSVEDGRVHGLGANDAKASVAAMVSTLLTVHARGGPCELGVLIACEEETGGEGTEMAWPRLREEGYAPEAVVVGEPTELRIAVAQKGLLVLELITSGDGGHAAHARTQGARSALRTLARDLVTLEELSLGEPHPELGPATLEPTVASAGEARNKVAERGTCILDVRTIPGVSHAEVAERIRKAVQGRVEIRSDRLVPYGCDPECDLVEAARAAHPAAELFGSATMSDLVHFQGVDAIKVGPGRSERSHRPDEFVLEEEILAGARFYAALVEEFARRRSS